MCFSLLKSKEILTIKMAVSILKHSSTSSTSSSKVQSIAAANNITPNEINTADSHGRTVLFYAAKFGKVNAVKNLLKAGGDPNVTDVDGSSPLHEAVERCHHNIVKLLLRQSKFIFFIPQLGTTCKKV